MALVSNNVTRLIPGQGSRQRSRRMLFVMFVVVNTIILLQLLGGIRNVIMLAYLQTSKQAEIAQQYLRLIEYKNRLDLVTSDGYLEYMLKANLQLYSPGEKLVILDERQLQSVIIKEVGGQCPPQKTLDARTLVVEGIRGIIR